MSGASSFSEFLEDEKTSQQAVPMAVDIKNLFLVLEVSRRSRAICRSWFYPKLEWYSQ
jgi:hypothetical protein